MDWERGFPLYLNGFYELNYEQMGNLRQIIWIIVRMINTFVRRIEEVKIETWKIKVGVWMEHIHDFTVLKCYAEM